jgi:hypothetical protein
VSWLFYGIRVRLTCVVLYGILNDVCWIHEVCCYLLRCVLDAAGWRLRSFMLVWSLVFSYRRCRSEDMTQVSCYLLRCAMDAAGWRLRSFLLVWSLVFSYRMCWSENMTQVSFCRTSLSDQELKQYSVRGIHMWTRGARRHAASSAGCGLITYKFYIICWFTQLVTS